MTVDPATTPNRSHAARNAAHLGLALLTLANLQLFVGYPAELSAIPLSVGAITLLLAIWSPWRLTLGICAAWPLLIDVRNTGQLVAKAIGWTAPDEWLASLPPYPMLTLVISVAGLVWAWRALTRRRINGSMAPDSIASLTWLWGAVVLLGTVTGLARLNPVLEPGFWRSLADCSWRWSMVADLDTLHPLPMGHAGIMGILMFGAIRSQACSSQRRRALAAALVVSAVALSALGIVQFLGLTASLTDTSTWMRDRRVVGLLRDPNSLGSLLTAALILALPTGLGSLLPRRGDDHSSRSAARMIVAAIALAALAAGLLMTGSRIAWIAAAVMLPGWLLIEMARRPDRPESSLPLSSRIAPVFALLWLIVLIWPTAHSSGEGNPIQRRLIDTLGLAEDSTDTELREGLAGRQHHWRVAGSMIAERPWWGQGVGTFRLLYRAHSDPDNPMERENAHNQMLQTWAESGLLGLLVLGLLIALALTVGRGDAAPKMALAGFLLTGLTGHPLLLPEMQLVLWILVTLAAPSPSAEEPSRGQRASGVSRWLFALLAAAVLLSGILSTTWAILRSSEHPMRWGLYEVFLSDQGGIPFIWTGEQAGFSVEVEEPFLALPLRAGHPDAGAEPVAVSLSINGQTLSDLTMRDNLWAVSVLDLRPWQGQAADIGVMVERTWSPSIWGVPDHRELGVAIGPWEGLAADLAPDPDDFMAWPVPPLVGEGVRP